MKTVEDILNIVSHNNITGDNYINGHNAISDLNLVNLSFVCCLGFKTQYGHLIGHIVIFCIKNLDSLKFGVV